jgi:rubrerythrin
MEEKQEKNYQKLAENFPGKADQFQKLAKDTNKHKERLKRTYRLGITDAFEVGFISSNINQENYKVKKVLKSGSLDEALSKIIKNEEKIIDFLEATKGSSGELIPDLVNTCDYLIRVKKRSTDKIKKMMG